jgi:hypothetical protein
MSLASLTLGYLTLPLVMFCVGWLRWSLGLPLAILLSVSAYGACPRDPADDEPAALLSRVWPWALAVALAWVMLSGSGPIGFQTADWLKHNAMLKAAMQASWPVYFADAPARPEPGQAALVYYLAYYLPAAVVGKVLGWPAGYVFLLGWTVLGVCLTLLWFVRLVGSSRIAITLPIFVFAGGLDALGILVLGRRWPPWLHIEWWTLPWQYPSNIQLLLWVPQHALGAWLSTALMVDRGLRGALPSIAVLIVATALFWSPLASLGLLPFVVYWCAGRPGALLRGWRNWAACPLIMVLAGFYGSLSHQLPHGLISARILATVWRRYLLFVGLKAGLYAGLCALVLRRDRRSLALLGVAGITLLLLPLYRLGLYNDFVMRVSIPSLFVLWVLVARSLADAPATLARRVLWGVFLIGAIGPLAQLAWAVTHFKVGIPDVASVAAVPAVQRERDPEIARQYVGDRGSFFFRVLAR